MSYKMYATTTADGKWVNFAKFGGDSVFELRIQNKDQQMVIKLNKADLQWLQKTANDAANFLGSEEPKSVKELLKESKLSGGTIFATTRSEAELQARREDPKIQQATVARQATQIATDPWYNPPRAISPNDTFTPDGELK